jgi:hypothetical protein
MTPGPSAGLAAAAAEGPSAPELSVFINCPFDGEYGPSLDAIIFTVICCGFEPRSAVDTDNTSDSRMKRIVDALRGSWFSIHDLSRIYGEAESNVAHLNMPLELGIAMALKQTHEVKESKRPHDWTALVLDGTAYQRAISDLNGHDLKRYASREMLVAQVMGWLVMRMKGRRAKFKPPGVLAALPDFYAALKTLRTEYQGVPPPWTDIVAEGHRIALANQLRPVPIEPEAGAAQ